MMRMQVVNPVVFVLALVVAGWVGCKEKPVDEPDAVNVTQGVLILNEGNFQNGNASLSYLDPQDSLHLDVFQRANGIPLGDVAQSMLLHDGALWVVVNNSGKIYRLEFPDLRVSCLIQGLTSPRYILPLGPDKAYVSDLYANAISILDPTACQTSGSWVSGGWVEEMKSINGKVYACRTSGDQVWVVDPVGDTVLDSIWVGRGPVSMVQDANGSLWVLCDGGLSGSLPSLHRIRPSDDSLLQSWSFTQVNSFPADLRCSPDGQTLYWLDGGIWRMSASDSTLPTSPWIPEGGRNFYALGINPVDGSIWASDAKDFVRKSEILVWDQFGNLIKSFQAGINSGEFLFLP